MKPFTVILLYPDYVTDNYGQSTYCAHVEAQDPCIAVAAARLSCILDNTNPGTEDDWLNAPEDLFVIAVFQGHLKDLNTGF